MSFDWMPKDQGMSVESCLLTCTPEETDSSSPAHIGHPPLSHLTWQALRRSPSRYTLPPAGQMPTWPRGPGYSPLHFSCSLEPPIASPTTLNLRRLASYSGDQPEHTSLPSCPGTCLLAGAHADTLYSENSI